MQISSRVEFIGKSWMCFLAVLFFLCPAFLHAEEIELFRSDIVVYKDAHFEVSEHVTYVFTEEKHGIYRCIPLIHTEKPESPLKERYIEINVRSVFMDEAQVIFEETRSDEEVCLKIGDPEKTITGSHVYTIVYDVAGALSYPPYGGADIYWNVTGNKWEVPIRSVEVRVSSPDPILFRERACYQGRVGEVGSCDIRTGEHEDVYFSGKLLPVGSGLTIAQALDRGKVAYDVRERTIPLLTILLGTILMLCILGIGTYRYKTRFKTGKTIIPEYEPYPDVKPMYAGILFDKRLDQRDIVAGIVYLAKEGFVKIRKVDRKVLFLFEVDDYELCLTRPFHEVTDAFERSVLELIFKRSTDVGAKVTLSDLKKDYSVAHENRIILQGLESELKKDMNTRGFFVGFNFSAVFNQRLILFVITFGVVLWIMTPHVLFIVFVVLIIVTLLILGEGRRTKKGYEALDHLKGFKDFLRVTESQRYIFHNAPEKNADQFMEYLPYAIAFGVEKEWAKTFEGISIPNPSWYEGGSATTFNALSLTQSLGGFSTAFASSSGASASSGGGSSGGGSGGGSGGSW